MKKLVCFILCFVLGVTSVYADFTPQIDITNGEKMYDFYNTLLRFTENNYRFGVSREELLEAAVKELLKNHPELFDELAKGTYSALDENSRYLSMSEFDTRFEEVSGQFEGVGINVSEFEGVTIVGAPIKGSPAFLAGIAAGDVIESVDVESIYGYVLDKAISMIKGEKGTSVELGIKRGNEQLKFVIVRDVIKINPVTYYKLDDGKTAYVNISTFNANTTVYLDEVLFNLNKEGVETIILDLRYNLGGLLSEAVKTASYFLPENSLVVTEDYSNPEKNFVYKSFDMGMKFNAVVLVNEYSASASEIVAGAIKDNKQGVLVGTTTFGKGTVQQSVHMKNGGAMWLTVAKYLTPSGAYIHKVGIEPDYYVANKKRLIDTSSFEAIKGERVLSVGNKGLDVLAVEQRLEAMGYPVEKVDEEFDNQTEIAVKRFQSDNSLFSYGVADLTTQIKIMDVCVETEVTFDGQLEKAKEIALGIK